MRVAHFVQRYPPALGGSEAYFAHLTEHLAGCGHDVTVFTTAANDLECFWSTRGRRFRPGNTVIPGVANGSGAIKPGTVEVRRYPLLHFPEQRRVLRLLSLIPHRPWQLLTTSCNPLCPRMLRDCLRPSERFDLVHATAFPYGWPLCCARILATRLGVPFAVTPFLHTGDPEDPRDRTRRAYTSPALLSLLHSADRVFVQTNVEREALSTLGIPSSKLILQGMGIDPGSCTGGDRGVRSAWKASDEDVVVGHLANHSVEKGTVDLLRAADLAWRAGHRCILVLAGPEMPNFRSFYERFRPAGRVLRLGVLDDRQKRDFFAGIDLFAMPSRSDSFGLVFLEAWANGVPNLAYLAGGVPGVIRHEEDGLLVRCGDLRGLADALGRLCENRDMRLRLGEAGKARLPRDFNQHDKLTLVESVYREMVAG